MKLIAIKAMRYGTRHLVADESFDARDAYAKVLIATRKARKAPGPGRPRKVVAVVAEPEAPKAVEVAAPTAPEPAAAPAPAQAHRLPHVTHVPTGRKPR